MMVLCKASDRFIDLIDGKQVIKQSENVQHMVPVSLPNVQGIIFDAIQLNPGLLVPQISEITGLKKPSVENAIKGLRRKGLIENKERGYYTTDKKI